MKNKRKKFLQKNRLEFAKYMLEEMGFDITLEEESMIEFYYQNELIKYFPFTGWATGKSIKDGRGLNNLIKQLK